MGWKYSRAGSTIEEIGFGLQTPLIQPPPNPAPKTSMPIQWRQKVRPLEFHSQDFFGGCRVSSLKLGA